MKRNIVIALALMGCIASLGSCAKDTVDSSTSGAGSAAQGEVTFLQSISSRVTDNDFDTNDAISITSYIDGVIEDSSVKYEWDGSAFDIASGETAIEINNQYAKSYVAVYPANTATSFTHTIATDQSSGYSESDLLVATEGASVSNEVTLNFDHTMTKLLVTITIDDERSAYYQGAAPVSLESLAITAGNKVAVNALAGTYVGDGTTTTITPYMESESDETSVYSVIVAPQAFSGSVADLDFKVGSEDVSENWMVSGSVDLASGSIYKVNWTVTVTTDDQGNIETDSNITISEEIKDWSESVDLGSTGWPEVIDNSTITGMSLTSTYGDMTCRGGNWSSRVISETLDGITFVEDDFSDADQTSNGFIGGTNDLCRALTYDLGKEYNLTEFKFWQRRWTTGTGNLFASGNIQYFQIWGVGEEAASGSSINTNYLLTKSITSNNNSEASTTTAGYPDFEGMLNTEYKWTLLLDVAEGKEQGYTDPLGGYSTELMYSDYISETNNSSITALTNGLSTVLNDRQVAAIEGHSFVLDNQDVAIRFIRIMPVQIWSGTYEPAKSTFPMIGEIQFTGVKAE